MDTDLSSCLGSVFVQQPLLVAPCLYQLLIYAGTEHCETVISHKYHDGITARNDTNMCVYLGGRYVIMVCDYNFLFVIR